MKATQKANVCDRAACLPNANLPVVTAGQNQVTLPATGPQSFFRLTFFTTQHTASACDQPAFILN